MDILETIREKISEADMVLLGIGEEFQINKEEILKRSSVYQAFAEEMETFEEEERNFFKNSLYVFEAEKGSQGPFMEKLEMYNRLHRLIEDKNYFAVTVCKDDAIYFSNFDSRRIVSPCGTGRQMKCKNGCQKEVFETAKIFQKLNCRLLQIYENGGTCSEIRQEVPRCRECGAYMEMNFAGTTGYSEKGYEKDWKRYMLWLQGTLNKKICILELGVGFSYPTVIRWPFEKVAVLNEKACFVRVNKKLPQIAKEIKEKSFSVKMDSNDFITELQSKTDLFYNGG